MVKDVEYFIDEFLRHHQSLGIKHALIIDNGSTDSTISRASRYDNVTIVQNILPPKHYESLLRRELSRLHIKGGWLLFMDSDELFELPSKQIKNLGPALDYCNQCGYTAVVCQVLDLFSDLPLRNTAGVGYAESVKLFNLYSIDDISQEKFHGGAHEFGYFTEQSRCESDRIKLFFGGIRRSVFGETCLLSAHRLVRNLRGIGIYAHPHFSTNVDCADFTSLIRHYKFCGDFVARESKQVSLNVWGHGQDRARMNVMSENQNLVIDCARKKEFKGADYLVDEGFLVMSEGLRQYQSSASIKK